MLILASLFISGLLLKGFKILFTNIISKIDQYYGVPIGSSSNEAEYVDIFSDGTIYRRLQTDLTNAVSKDNSNTSLKKLHNEVPVNTLNSRIKGKEVFMPARFHQTA